MSTPEGESPPPAADDTRPAFLRGLDTLWDESDDGRPPTPRTVLDRDRIVAAAIAIADRDGIDAVSMRRVAGDLGAGPMSLYRHVPDKDALISLMLDAVLAEGQASPAAASGDWRADLRRLAAEMWRLMRRHPWYAETTFTRPPLTPRGMAGLELALSMLDDVGLDIVERMQIVGTIHLTVLSAALNAAIEDRTRAEMAASGDDVSTTIAPYARRVMESGAYPRVSELFASFIGHLEDGSLPGGDEHSEEEMLAAIDLILDGVATRVAPPGAQRP